MGGLESHVSSLAKHLQLQGHDVFVYTLSEKPEKAIENGIAITRYSEYFQVGSVLGFARLGTSRKLREALRADRIDIVSVHTRFFTLTWLGLFAAKRVGVPVIHTEHGSGFVVASSVIISWCSRLVDWTLGRLALRKADAVLGVSEDVLRFVKQLSGRDGELFYNAIESPQTASLPVTQVRPSHLVFVGRLVPGKGWDTFIEVTDRLVNAGHDVTAEILGDGPDMPALRTRVSLMSDPSRIAIRGRVAPEEVRVALRGATLVNPTKLAEGFQTTLLEALAEGASVVTYPVPGANALLVQGGPVRITEHQSPDELYSEITQLLAAPPVPAPEGFIDPWTWPERTRQFEQICNRVLLKK